MKNYEPDYIEKEIMQPHRLSFRGACTHSFMHIYTHIARLHMLIREHAQTHLQVHFFSVAEKKLQVGKQTQTKTLTRYMCKSASWHACQRYSMVSCWTHLTSNIAYS